DARPKRLAISAEPGHDTALSRGNGMERGPHQPYGDKADNSPYDHRTVRAARQSAASAEAGAAAAQPFVERGDARARRDAPASALGRLAPRTTALTRVGGRFVAAAGSRAPGAFGVGEKAANTAAPPR